MLTTPNQSQSYHFPSSPFPSTSFPLEDPPRTAINPPHLNNHLLQATDTVHHHSPNHLSIFQLNCHTSKMVTHSVLNLALDHDILILQEPWVDPFSFLPPSLPAWRRLTSYEHHPTGWPSRHKVAILIRSSFPAASVKLLDGGSQCLVAMELSVGSTTLRLLNVYNPTPSFSAIPEI